MGDNLIVNKSYEFALEVIEVYKFLTERRKEFVLSKQLLRSGTSIGANVRSSKFYVQRSRFYVLSLCG
ncbi:MAG: four helix bundle protein [Candidatus Marinimicrobia bacterium]|nr:four helix bundle protein [Candidatus Neomarinimicrobiota bacterium]